MTRTFGQRISSALDAVAYAVSPAWGARRMSVRRLFEQSTRRADQITSRALESAEVDRLREGRWLGSRLSTDAWLEEDLENTRRRSRELYRNDFIGGAVDARVEHVVDTGFTVQAKIKPVPGLITTAQAKQFNGELETVFAQIEPIACRTRKRSLWQKTCLVARNIDVDGEALVVFSDVGHADAPIPLVVEVIDVDRLETPPEKTTDPLCRMGVQHDAQKRIVGYWIRRNHPDDNKEFGMKFDYVEASRVCHIFVEWFAGQSRGLPWMMRSLNRAKDGKDLQEASIISAQVEACFAAFVEGDGNPLANAVGASTGSDSVNRLQDVIPGTISYLARGQKISFATPTKSNSVGTTMEYNNRTISAGQNWPYEMLMKDWRGVSFAGGRIILHGAKLSTRGRQKLIAEMFLRCYWNRMVDECVIVGATSIDPRRYAEQPWRFKTHSWTPPKWGYAITPGEEVKAKILAVENNFTTLADILAEDQLDLEEVLPQRAKERQLERELEIVPPDLSAGDVTAAQAQSPQDAQQLAETIR